MPDTNSTRKTRGSHLLQRVEESRIIGMKTLKYRLFPNTNQKRELEISLETHRRLYNECLEWKEHAWDVFKASLSFSDQSRWFKFEKRRNPYYARLNHSSAQQTIRRVDKTYRNFFRAIKAKRKFKIRYKSRSRFNSFEYMFGDGATLRDGKLRLQHIGLIRVKWHRELEGKIKRVTILRELDKWYVCFTVETKPEPKREVETEVGIDVGIRTFLTTDRGEQVENPTFLKTHLPELRRQQRSVSRKKKGSRRRKKAVKKLAKLHQKIRRCRRDFHHKVARILVNRFDFIVAESLNVCSMQTETRRVNRAISDSGLTSFITILNSKAESAGCQFMLVDAKGTSQECSRCGQIAPKKLSDRAHKCSCGLTMDRDQNAARNILRRGQLTMARAIANESQTGQ